MKKKYLIFGATGAVGSSLSKLLKDESLEAHLVGKNEEEISKLADQTGFTYSVANVLEEKGEHQVALALVEGSIQPDNVEIAALIMKLKLSLSISTPVELGHQIDKILEHLHKTSNNEA